MATLVAVLLAVLIIILVVSTPIFFAARKLLKVPRGAAIGFAAILGPIIIGTSLWSANECSVSNYMTTDLKTNLSPKEFSSLRGDRFICPTSGSFQRDKDGKRVGVYVLEELHQSSVRIIDDSP